MRYYAFLLIAFCSMFCMAQNTPFYKYDTTPTGMEEMFLDLVENNLCSTVGSGQSQYRGQVDREGIFCGYGTFINGDGSQIIGKFHNGKPLQNITLAKTIAVVGAQDRYCIYSLESGRLMSVCNEKVDESVYKDYTFMSVVYSNGDRYVGEMFQGRRHGLGIYYYANGNIWYGTYHNDVRIGYGALFCPDEGMEIGRWEGEDTRRHIYVRELPASK